MRKAGLLDKKPLTATAWMLSLAKRDTGTVKQTAQNRRYTEYETRHYFRAAPSATEGILEVDLFTRKDLAEGKKEPRFRIFLDYERKDFESWNITDEKWSRAKTDMLDTGDVYPCSGRNYAAETTRNLVNRCLGTGNMHDVETAVLEFQLRVRKDELKKRHRLITDMIDGYMETVPDRLPADWMGFINRKALEPGHCILYDRKSLAGWCTCCRLHVRVPDSVRHNMSGKCTCGSRITYKSWKRQKSVTYDTTVSVIQKCTGGQNFAYRQFSVHMVAEREKEYVPDISFHEEYRRLLEITDRKGPLYDRGGYEWGVFRSSGVERWCQEGTANHGGFGNSRTCRGYSRSVPYTSNLKRIFKGTKLQYVPVAGIMKSTDKRLDVIGVLANMGCGVFPYEAFWKMGLKRFVRERAERGGTDGLTRRTGYSGKPWQHLGITREDMKQALRIDATDQQMRIIQRAAEMNVRLEDGQIMWLDKNVGVSVLMEYFTVHTPHRIIRYMKENVGIPEKGDEGKEMLHFWTDYLGTAGQLGWNLHDRAVFFPQNIRRAHDEAAAVFTLRKNEKKAAEMKEKDRIMHGHAEQIKKIFSYRDERYMIKVPGCYLDFRREGQMQHNCVATYYDRVLEGRCIILFIRKRGKPREPFCTVEIQKNNDGKFRIVQNREDHNRPAPEDARAFMEAAVREAQKMAEKMAEEKKAENCMQAAV